MSTNNNPDLNDAISSRARGRCHNDENCLCSFVMEEIKFLKSKINFKNEIIKSLFTSKSVLHNKLFFSHNSEQIKNWNKNFHQKTDNSTEILQGHINKAINNYGVDKIIKEKNDSFK